MLVIRLQRAGRKKAPFYRIVVAEKSSPVKGRFLERVGHYNPMTTPKEIVIDSERIKYYLKNGAQPSQTVARLLTKNGLSEGEKYITVRAQKPSKAELAAAKKVAEEAAAKKAVAKVDSVTPKES